MPDRSTTDVLIAGGGIIGASIAWRLAQQGLRVTVCDSGTLGGEASFAGAGMLVPGSEFDQGNNEWLEFGLHSLELYPAFVAELQEASNASIDFSICGSLELAASETELDLLQARAQVLAEFAFPGEPVSQAELASLVPSIDASLVGAIFHAKEAQVDPRTVISALRIALLQRGTEIRENVRIAAINASGNVQVAAGETIEARRIVIAAGAWASLLPLRGVQPIPDSFPVRGHLIGYPLPPGSLPHLLRLHHTYAVQRQSGYTIAGSSEEQVGFQRTVDPGIVDEIAARAHQLCALLPHQPRDAWIGFRPATSHSGPVIGQWLDTSVWLAYGHYRNGILLAPATAERVANGILRSL